MVQKIQRRKKRVDGLTDKVVTNFKFYKRKKLSEKQRRMCRDVRRLSLEVE